MSVRTSALVRVTEAGFVEVRQILSMAELIQTKMSNTDLLGF